MCWWRGRLSGTQPNGWGSAMVEPYSTAVRPSDMTLRMIGNVRSRQTGETEQDRHALMLFRPQKMLNEVDHGCGLPKTKVETGEDEVRRSFSISHSGQCADQIMKG